MWREEIIKFAEGFQHPSWGIGHYQRVYELSLKLADDKDVDEASLFAASYLHDLGAFAPYKEEGIDHAKQSCRYVSDILKEMNFPKEKIPLVKEIIEGHMFYENPSSNYEAIIFHDADTLEFMGLIGITRILAIVGIDDWTPNLKTAIDLIKQFTEELPTKLITAKAKEIGEVRRKEMINYIKVLEEQTSEFSFI